MAEDILTAWAVDASGELLNVQFGTVRPASAADRTFRVKNLSTAYTAREVAVSVQDSAHADATDLYLSLDGQTFTASVALGDLPPSATSPALTLRRVTPHDATGTVWNSLVLTCGSWD